MSIKAIKIEFDETSGRRGSSNSNPLPWPDSNLVGHPSWQFINPDGISYEMRLVKNGRAGEYTKYPGVTIYTGESAIDAELDALALVSGVSSGSVSYSIWDSALMAESIRQNVDLTASDAPVPGDTQQVVLSYLYSNGVLGITESSVESPTPMRSAKLAATRKISDTG